MNQLKDYGKFIGDLIDPTALPPLGPGSPNTKVHGKLKELQITAAFAPHEVQDREMAACCLSGLWLLHGYLDESHKISQDIATSSGNYWHGIMHRREPDPANAAYWFRRVGQHPIFDTLAQDAARLGLPMQEERWDPFGFIDLCEQHRGSDSQKEVMLRQIQMREWELLFEWCFCQATKS